MPSSSLKLQGQVALVAGGGRGLGRATALAFAREGANVVVADVLGDEVQETERDIAAAGVRGLGLSCDVSNETQVQDLVDTVVREFGQLDVLVNTVAWIDPPGLLVDMPLEVWEKTLTYDVTTHFLCAKHALRVMIPRGYDASSTHPVRQAKAATSSAGQEPLLNKNSLLRFDE